MKTFIFLLLFLLFLSCENSAGKEASSFSLHSENFQEVNIPDVALKKCIKLTMRLLEDEPITRENATNLLRLKCVPLYDDQIIHSLEGLQFFTDLLDLVIDDNKVTDLSPVAGLKKVRLVSARNNGIKDLYPLAFLPNSATLHLDKNNITIIAPLIYRKNLSVLTLSENKIRDTSTLFLLTNLAYLDLSHNQVTDINYVSFMPNLVFLYASNNQIGDISPLKQIGVYGKIEKIDLSHNRINDVIPLRYLMTEEYINLSSNLITNPQPLSHLIQLKKLDLSHNCINTFDSLFNLSAEISKDNQNGPECGGSL